MEVQDKITQSDNVQAEKLQSRRKNSRKRSIIIFTVVSLLNAGLLILLWSQLLTPAPNANKNNSDGLQLLKGHPAPDFALAALTAQHAQTIHLANFKGKPVVLNFWNSTCGPCQEEAPMLQTQAQHAQTKGIVFIGVDFQDTQTDGLSFLKKYGVTYLNVLDADGSTSIHYGVVYMPTTFFINSQGVVVHTISREMTQQELQQNLHTLS
jgi:cytochrome c biogenesis protein CcmG, thiol:disulfide interchange protein DsbE